MPLNDPQLFRQQCLIDGTWCDGDQGERETVVNPATGEPLAAVAQMSAAQTQTAIDAAERALPGQQRAARLQAWADLIDAAREDLAQLLTAEQGKPLALAVLATRAGIPRGVLQVVAGPAVQVGKVLCDSPVVRKLSFTGSTEVGRLLMAQCAPTVKKLSLELGGNAPVLVFDDADVDQAVAGIMAAKFRNSGQTCVCANRIYVQRGIYPALVEKLQARVQELNVGPGTAPDVTQGPLIDASAVAKVREHIADALAQGATLLAGGKSHALGGSFFEPTLIGDVSATMRFAREETFGPVAPLFPFSDEAEAIRMANDTEFGLAAYVFTRDAGRQWRVPEALEYGMVGVNTGLISNEVAPFGGVKQSGLGREGSRFGIEEYLEMKYLCVAVDPAC
ncbi:NAD-dependent succinate-semialdehyde dehydrogenase [Sodalis endosymbiont of Spalangia cameroni]|uniref:NAD-dependent succinate-semialdehyde dehydrogenase n=1 Tax=Sodalis praecaptivus TaxID=1239307 RepID=UPI0031F90E56